MGLIKSEQHALMACLQTLGKNPHEMVKRIIPEITQCKVSPRTGETSVILDGSVIELDAFTIGEILRKEKEESCYHTKSTTWMESRMMAIV